jgi:hypothetical protein
MKPALPAAFREGAAAGEIVLVSLLVVAAVVSALTFEAAVHPERIHHPRHQARFAADSATLPALGAIRVRVPGDGTRAAFQRVQGLGTASGLSPATLGFFRRARYLRASPDEVADAVAKLDRGEAPVPPPAPDLSAFYRDARGPYLCDLVLASGKTVMDVRAAVPAADLSGEPLLREAEDREAASIVRALLLGLPVAAAWLAWRRGRREMLARLLAALLVLVALGLFGAGIDRGSVAGLVLVAGASTGAPLLAAAPCLLFPFPALHRLGLVLCLGGALRLLLRRPALRPLPPRAAIARAAALAFALGALSYLALAAAPARVPSPPEVEAEPGALLVPKAELAATAERLRAEGLRVTGDEPLLPQPPDPRRRRDLWRILTRATALANRAEGEARPRFEDVADAAAQMNLTTLPKDLRWRLRARDGRSVLWAPSDADRDDLTSARLYRARGERELRAAARLAGILVALAGALSVGVLRGALGPVLRRFAGAALGAALLLLAAPQEADLFLPLVPLAAMAPALCPAIALGAAALFLPGVLWPAAAFLVAALLPYLASRRQRPSPM